MVGAGGGGLFVTGGGVVLPPGAVGELFEPHAETRTATSRIRIFMGQSIAHLTRIRKFAILPPVAKPTDPLKELQAFVAKYPTKVAAADALGIGQPYLHDLLEGNRNFSDNILEKLGLARIETIVKAS